MLPVSVIYVISLVLTSFCKEYYQFFLAQAILAGICLGFLFSNSLAIIGHYFDKRYGLASGVVMAGAAVGGVIFPIALNRLLNEVGLSFGWSVRICALVVLVLLACMFTHGSVPSGTFWSQLTLRRRKPDHEAAPPPDETEHGPLLDETPGIHPRCHRWLVAQLGHVHSSVLPASLRNHGWPQCKTCAPHCGHLQCCVNIRPCLCRSSC